jgi:hypothetical protein
MENSYNFSRTVQSLVANRQMNALETPTELWIYGAGQLGTRLAHRYLERGLPLRGFIDQKKAGPHPETGLPILSLDTFLQNAASSRPVTIVLSLWSPGNGTLEVLNQVSTKTPTSVKWVHFADFSRCFDPTFLPYYFWSDGRDLPAQAPRIEAAYRLFTQTGDPASQETFLDQLELRTQYRDRPFVRTNLIPQ